MVSKTRKNIIPHSTPKSKTLFFYNFERTNSLIDWINKNRVKNHDYRKYPAKLLNIDCSKVKFLKPYHIAPLSCLIHEYQVDGFRIKIKNIPNTIKDYLNSFDFDQFCEKRHKNNFLTPKDPKVFPLWRIEQDAISIYPKKVQEYFERNHFDGKSLFSLSISLAELLNNVFDHSGSSIPGYTFTQYNPKKKSIVTCVCDFGVGIPFPGSLIVIWLDINRLPIQEEELTDELLLF